MENFPKLPSRPRANRNPTKESSSTQLVEDKLREMEEKMNQQMEDKI